MANETNIKKKLPFTEILLLIALPLSNIAYQYLAKTIAFNNAFENISFNTLLLLVSNFKFWLMVVLETFSLIIWLKILSDMDLAKAFPITALAYVAILFISIFSFQEKLHFNDFIGSALILGGILILLSIKNESE